MTLEELLEKSVESDKKSQEGMELNYPNFYRLGGYNENPFVSLKTQYIMSIIKELALDDTSA